MAETHYLPKYAPNIGPLQMAVCRRWIDPRTEASDEPSCEKCDAWLNPPEDDAPLDPQDGSACSAACGWCGGCSAKWAV